ncbi:MAG: AAA family ATPase [Oscillospiraceae bacterium]
MPETVAKKIVLASGKGGVGKSTLATAFADRLYSRGFKVLMIDCDIGLRSLDTMLKLSDKIVYDWSDVIFNRCQARDAMVYSECPVLLAAPQADVNVTEQDMQKLIKRYEKAFDYVIIDAPAGMGKGFRIALAMADEAFVISTPDTICARSAGAVAQKIFDSGIEPKLIINKFNKFEVYKGNLLNIDAVIDQVGAMLIGVVPDEKAFAYCLIKGEVPDEGLKSIRAVDRIIRRMNGEQLKLEL